MSLRVGHKRDGRDLILSDEDRARHIHLLGASGKGKSSLLEHMIEADIHAGRGLCLIDPHGTLANAVLAWCASRRMDKCGRIHVLEPPDPNWCVGFNPLRLDGMTHPQTRVDAMVNACVQVWGGRSMADTPLLKKCLRAVLYALAVRDLTLAEAPELISSTGAARRTLTENLPDYVFASLWREFNALSRREFAEQFSSTANRLVEFLSSPLVRRIVGQRRNVLDLKRIMDNGDIVIVNLSHQGSLSWDDARLIGTLLTSELFLLAKTRDPETAKQHPFYLYIDECADYLTSDIERMLDQTRKFGLHLILSHQRLGQLGQPHDPIYNGVMAGGQTKIVFGGLEDDDAEVMARQILRDTFNLQEPKHVLDKLFVVDEVPFWLESESWSEGTGSATTSSDSVSWGSASGASETVSARDNTVVSSGSSSTQSAGGGYSTSESHSTSSQHTRGFSQTLKPVRELQPTAVYSLEEQTHRAIVRLRGLPDRVAMVRPQGRVAVRIRTPDLKQPIVWLDLTKKFRGIVSDASPYTSPIDAADAEMQARQTAIHGAESSPEREASFWHEEPAGD